MTTPMTDREFAAWAAGFFDGEGCVSITIGGNRFGVSHYLQVVVAQVDPRPLELLASRFGGSITPRNRASQRPNEQPAQQWRLYGRSARPFLEAVAPYLIVKGEPVRIGLKFLALGTHPGRRGAGPSELVVREELRLALRLANNQPTKGRKRKADGPGARMESRLQALAIT
jgi:hypothetical protein